MSSYLGAEQNESRECTDALDDEGYVLMHTGTTGQVAKCTAGSPVYGVAEKSTVNRATKIAEANKQVAVLRKPKFAMVQINLASTDPDIGIGDWISVKGANAAGQAKKHVGTAVPAAYAQADLQAIGDELEMIVGQAQEAKAAPGAGNEISKIKVQLTCPNFGRQES